MSQALLRYNRFDTATPVSVRAMAVRRSHAAQANGWCAPVTANSSGGTYSYSVKPEATGSRSSRGALRRPHPPDRGRDRLRAPAAQRRATPSTDEVFAKDWITIANWGPITADVGTRHLTSPAGQDHLRHAQAGDTTSSRTTPAPSSPTPPDFDLPAVNRASPTPRTTTACSPPGCYGWVAATKWLSTRRVHDQLGTAGATHNYYVCKLSLN